MLRMKIIILHVILFFYVVLSDSLFKDWRMLLVLYVIIFLQPIRIAWGLPKGTELDIHGVSVRVDIVLPRALGLAVILVPIYFLQRLILGEPNNTLWSAIWLLLFLVNTFSGLALVYWSSIAGGAVVSKIYLQMRSKDNGL